MRLQRISSFWTTDDNLTLKSHKEKQHFLTHRKQSFESTLRDETYKNDNSLNVQISNLQFRKKYGGYYHVQPHGSNYLKL